MFSKKTKLPEWGYGGLRRSLLNLAALCRFFADFWDSDFGWWTKRQNLILKRFFDFTTPRGLGVAMICAAARVTWTTVRPSAIKIRRLYRSLAQTALKWIFQPTQWHSLERAKHGWLARHLQPGQLWLAPEEDLLGNSVRSWALSLSHGIDFI